MKNETCPKWILDIGIGRGGDYIDHDELGVIRIGVDVDRSRLRSMRKHYPSVIPIKMNAFTSGREFLPFADRTFQEIEILFPHNDLLFALANDNASTLWQQMHRILLPGGNIHVVFDVPPDNTRWLHVKRMRQTIGLEYPEDHIWRMATNASFLVTIEPIERNKAYALRSDYGMTIAHKMRLDPEHRTYILTAEKNNSYVQ